MGWREGIQSVSVTQALSEHVGSLVEAKRLLEGLLDGDEVQLDFPTELAKEEFRAKLEGLGVTTG